MRRSAAVAVLVLCSCYAAERPGEYPGPRHDAFGYLTAGVQFHVDYTGGFGLEAGTGWSVSVPPMVPLVFAADIALIGGMICLAASAEGVAIYADLGDGMLLIPPDDPAIWTSGIRDASGLMSEVSWELTAEGSHHGPDSAFRLLAGLKVAANRETVLRSYGCGGWSWHWIDVASGADIPGNGPYLGGGLEFFPGPTGCVGLDARWHWVRAEGHGTSGLFTLGVSWSAHW